MGTGKETQIRRQALVCGGKLGPAALRQSHSRKGLRQNPVQTPASFPKKKQEKFPCLGWTSAQLLVTTN